MVYTNNAVQMLLDGVLVADGLILLHPDAVKVKGGRNDLDESRSIRFMEGVLARMKYVNGS